MPVNDQLIQQSGKTDRRQVRETIQMDLSKIAVDKTHVKIKGSSTVEYVEYEHMWAGIVTASSNSHFVTVTKENKMLTVTSLPLQRLTKVLLVTLLLLQMVDNSVAFAM